MESSRLTSIRCPLHPRETIMRVDSDFGCEKEIYCIECLLHVDNPNSLSVQLKPLDEFIDTAAKYYEENRQKSMEDTETPEDYLQILTKQTENIEAIAKHIEEEKKRVQAKYDTITKDILKLIAEKRDESFALLDQQLFNYRYGYIFYAKQLRKAFPKVEDLSLYPSKEELLSKLSKLQNSQQLLTFVKNLKEDINENKLFQSEEGELSANEARRFLIKSISKKLDEYKTKLPTLIDPEADYAKAKDVLDKAVVKMIDTIFGLENGIEDISTGDSFPKSSLAKATDFGLIKKWLDKEYKNKKFKLVYKGTKDGLNATAFHEKANNKGPTITIIKSSQDKIFGGFMPDAWTSRNGYINTRKSWLFSLTNKAKYEMNSPDTYAQYGGYDYSSYGPTFGGGHDIYLATDFGTSSNYCNRHSYNFTDNTSLTGGYNFTVTEVEVFSLDK